MKDRRLPLPDAHACEEAAEHPRDDVLAPEGERRGNDVRLARVDEGEGLFLSLLRELLFQPVYHPWVNRIERLWMQLRENITRNHRYPKLDSLMQAVRTFLHVVQPFPGSGAALAKV